jgi:hypothetical protein
MHAELTREADRAQRPCIHRRRRGQVGSTGRPVADLTETFANLRRYQIKLNPLKSTFGVPTGQLLGYIVSARGIEANQEKISVIMRITRPAFLLDAQKLTERVAALSRFIP